jgi:hypothetical protein
MIVPGSADARRRQQFAAEKFGDFQGNASKFDDRAVAGLK